MRAPNHVAGGIVFTGIFCSFWNVNIFASPALVGLTVFASLLPDIDHSRSIMGKFFLPVSRYLDRNYGHRTITHSLVFFVISGLAVAIIGELLDVEDCGLIYAFAFGSHLIFDMLTRQGVPLFYPWMRNPCVIGGNPDMRLSGKGNSEIVVFSLFLVMLYFCFPLFENGFWMSYNKNFNTLKHLHSSASQISPNLLTVDYEFENNFEKKSGSGILVYHESNEAILLDGDDLVKISGTDVVRKLQPEKTELRAKLTTVHLEEVAIDSIHQLSNAIIVSGELISEQPFQIRSSQGVETTQKAGLSWSEGFTINLLMQDSSELQKKRIELEYAQSMFDIEQSHLSRLKQDEKALLQLLEDPQSDDYRKEVSVMKLKEVKKKIENYSPNNSQVQKVRSEVKQLEEKYRQAQRFSGKIVVLEVL